MNWRKTRLSTLVSGTSVWRLCFFVVFVLSTTISAFAQLSTGSIAGTVKDSTGAVIPGVSVTMSNPGVIGGNQQTVTNERGTYQFTRLVPGKYSVRAELTGFRPSALSDLTVNADVTVRADLTLEIGNVADSVTVTGESPLLDTTSTLNQAVLDRGKLDTLPTGHDLWSIARMVPGVVPGNYDVGGNQSFQQSSPTVHGSSDNKYAIDGMDVAWAGGASSVMVYFDPNMFEEINYQVGNISAENRQGGVVMNMVTKTGTNAFHGSFQFTGTKNSLIGDNISPALATKLSAQIPASVLTANPNIRPGQQIQSLFDTAASLSGPVIKDRFWFTTTYKISSLNQFVLGNYNPNGTQGIDDNRILNGTFKLSYQLTHGSQLHYTYSRNLKYRYHRRDNTYMEDAASRFQNQWADIHQVKWTDTISAKIVVDAGASLQVGPTPYVPRPGGEAEANAALGLFPKMDQATGAYTVMNPGYQSQPQYRVASNFNLSYFAGRHELKFGYQLNRIMLRSENWSLVKDPDLPGVPFSARYNNGSANAVLMYNYPTDSKVFLQEHGFFLQDKWTATRKLTINAGIRFDRLNAWVPAVCQPDTAVIVGQCFPQLKDPAIPRLFNMAPRFGFIYDVAGDGHTAIKGSANVYHVGLASGYPNLLNPYSTATNTCTWNDLNNDKKPQMNEIGFNFVTKQIIPNGGCSGFSFGNTNLYDPNLNRPYSVEFSVGLQRQLPGDFVVSATYFRRDSWRTMGVVNTALSPASYDPIDITLPENGQKLTIYNIKPSLQALQNCTGIAACNLTSNHSDRGDYFNGLDLTANKRLSNHFSATIGLSLNSGQRRLPYRPDNPNLNIFAGGVVSGNVPREFKLSGVYQAPLGFQIAGNFQAFSGKPEGETYQITKSLVPNLTLSSLTVNLANFGVTSLPAVQILDLSIGREFRLTEKKVRISPKIELFNLNNSDAVQGRSTLLNGTASSVYLNPSSILSPRTIRLGLQTNF